MLTSENKEFCSETESCFELLKLIIPQTIHQNCPETLNSFHPKTSHRHCAGVGHHPDEDRRSAATQRQRPVPPPGHPHVRHQPREEDPRPQGPEAPVARRVPPVQVPQAGHLPQARKVIAAAVVV